MHPRAGGRHGATWSGRARRYQRPVAAGAAGALGATLVTWFIAVGIIESLADNVSGAATCRRPPASSRSSSCSIVMNWFFHKVYWTGWISMHSRPQDRQLMKASVRVATVAGALALLGFSSVYREGFEVVLFLQSYRLKLGTGPVLYGRRRSASR